MKLKRHIALTALLAFSSNVGCSRVEQPPSTQIVDAAFARTIPVDRAPIVAVTTVSRDEAALYCVVEIAEASDTAHLSLQIYSDAVTGVPTDSEPLSAIEQACDSSARTYALRIDSMSTLRPGRYRCVVSLWDGCCDGWVTDGREIFLVVA